MHKPRYLLIALLISPLLVPWVYAQNAQPDAVATAALQAQLGAVSQAQQQYEDERQAEAEAEARRNAAFEAAHERQVGAALAEQRRAVEAKAAAIRERAKRDEDYQDQLRQMHVEAMKIQLQEMHTAANRENDMITSKLNQQQAETNVIQSEAHVNRALSDGTKTLLEDTGKAELKD